MNPRREPDPPGSSAGPAQLVVDKLHKARRCIDDAIAAMEKATIDPVELRRIDETLARVSKSAEMLLQAVDAHLEAV